MSHLFRAAVALLTVVCFFPATASAQNTYDVYIDTNGAAGCDIVLPGGTFAGADRRLQVTATSGGSPQVTSVTFSTCNAGVFGPPAPAGGGYPVGLNNGIGGSDVIELSAAVAGVFHGATSARFGFSAVGPGGADVLFTVNGTPGGGPIGTTVLYSIPLLGLGGLLLLAALMLVVAKRAGRHRLTVRMIAVGLLLTSGIAIAANFIVDGQVGDWTGEPADALDPAGDSSNGAANLDLRAGFIAVENGNVFFRIDVADLQNQPPIATPQTVATNEDTAVTITLASTDPENDPRTYTIATPPANGTLGAITQAPPASATVQYTPNPDFNGADSFTFRATDSQGAVSTPATVTINVAPVNDRPTFTATNPPAVNEDAGLQTIPNWATFSAGPANESAQTVLAYTVSNVSNAALFSTAPAVASNGTLTYMPALNQFGTSTFDVVVQDSGGTANGGIDTSLVQTFTITVNAVNGAPVLTAGATLAYTENGPAAAIDNTITVADVDDTNLESATAQITAGYQNGADVLACGACGAITATFAAGTGTLTLNGTATLAAYQAALRSVTYVNTSETPTAGARTITWIGNDGTVGSTPVASTVNVTAVNDAPVNTVPLVAQQAIASGTLTFSVANGNAISIADADTGTANVQSTVSVAPANGSFVPAAGSGAAIVGSGTNSLGITGTLTQVNAALNGLVYTAPNATAAITATILTSDLGNTPAPAQTDTDTITINVDAAPTVTTVTPTNAATGVATNTSLTVNFSENVDITAGGITLTCGAGNLVTGGLPVANTNTVTVTTTGIPAGTLCTGTVLAANVTDSDLIDSPNNLAANFTWTFTTDASPAVTTVTPANGATGVPTNTQLTVNFNEAVTVAAGGITLTCGAGNLVTTGLPSTGTGVTVNTAGVPAGTLCTGTVLAANVTDSDAGDPPDNMLANFTWSFTTDFAPSVSTVTPPNGATNVATNTSINVIFSENVDVAAGGITLTCGAGNLVTGGLPATNTTSVTATTTGVPEGTLCTGTVLAANVADTDLNDPPNNMAANFTWTFTTDAAPTVMAVTPPNATTALVGTDVTVTFSEPVTVAGTWFMLACAISGTRDTTNTVVSGGSTTFRINPNVDFTPGETCNGTIVAGQVSDNDAGDPPNNLAANFTWSFATDAAPTVTTVTPPNGATGVATDTSLTVNFSESVTVAAGGITLTCGAGNLVTTGLSATGASVVVNTAGIPGGTLCTGTVVAANVTDTDANDPPDNMASNFTWTFTTDAAPAVTTVSPPNGATGVPTDTQLTVNFSEAVTVSAGGITLTCGAGNLVTTGLPTTGTSATVSTAGVPAGTLCTGTVLAANVTDSDAGDPSDNLGANFTWTFMTDAAPSVTTVTPADGATQVAANTSLTVNFSENVDVAAGGITLTCGAGNLVTTGLPAANTNSVTVATASVPAGTLCTGTVVAANVTDFDTNDPPNNLAANFTWTFTTDAAPAVTTTVPANGATGVAASTTITINFTESVNFDVTANAANTSFDLECPVGTPANFTVVTASPATSVVLNPLDSALAGQTCTVSVRAAGITDADAGDPPDNMVADFVFGFSVPPVAVDDTYAPNIVGNVGVNTANSTNFSVLTNDTPSSGITPALGTTTPAGATVTFAANGAFSYIPPPGYEGPASFTYTLTGAGGTSAPATVSLNIAGMIWFVDESAAVAGNGRLNTPFDTLAAFQAVNNGAGNNPAAGDNVFLFQSASSYVGPVTLLNNQKLIGQDATATLATIAGVTLPADSFPLPAMDLAAPASTVTDTAAGGAIRIGLGNSNIVRGLTIGNVSAAGTGILSTGANFGTLTALDLIINTNGRALSLNSGTLTATFNDLDTSGGSNQGILLNAVGGTWSVASNASIGNVSGTAVDIQNAPAGASLTFTGGLTINKASAGTGLLLNANAGTAAFNALNVTTGAGTAISASNAPLVATSGMVSATGGVGVNASDVAFGTTTFTSVTSSGSATQGINLNNITGTLNLGGGSITTATGTSFQGQGTLGTTSYSGAITKSNAGKIVVISGAAGGNATLSGNLTCDTVCTGIDVLNRNAGTIVFSGGTKTLNTGASNGVTLTGNAGASVNFTNGGLDIDTSSGTGFNATGGATAITVETGATANTITSTSGVALNVNASTIGGAGLTFQSIASGAGANHGISLVSSGADGLTVTGLDGADAGTDPDVGSGGTINGKTGADGSATAGSGVFLSNANNVSLNGMIITNHQNYGIRGVEVDGFRLTFSQIAGLNGTNVATPFNEGSISFIGTPTTGYGLRGSVAFLDNEITGGRQRNVSIDNATGTMNLNFLRNNVHDTQPTPNGDDGLAIEVDTSAVMFANVSNNVFTAHGGDHFNLSLVNNANADLTFRNNDMQGGFGSALGQGVFILGASYNGTFRYDISDNGTVADPFVGNVQGAAIFVNKGSGTATYSGRIQNNVIGNPAIVASGSAQAQGIHASARGAGGSHTTLITNNLVRQYFDRGIVLEAGEGAPAFTATVTNNTVSNFADAINSLHGIHCDFGILAADNAQITIDIRGNSIATAGNEPQGGADFRMRTASSNDTFIAGYSGGNSAANAQAFIATQNPSATTVSVTQAGTGTYNNGPLSPLPPPTLPTLPPPP